MTAAGKVAADHNERLDRAKTQIEGLQRENKSLRRQIDSYTGRAPGGSGENPTATGG